MAKPFVMYSYSNKILKNLPPPCRSPIMVVVEAPVPEPAPAPEPEPAPAPEPEPVDIILLPQGYYIDYWTGRGTHVETNLRNPLYRSQAKTMFGDLPDNELIVKFINWRKESMMNFYYNGWFW